MDAIGKFGKKMVVVWVRLVFSFLPEFFRFFWVGGIL